MALTPHAPRSAAGPLAETLRYKILERRFSAHEPLPSLRQLSNRYGVGIQVVRSALARLEAEGLVYSLERRGTFVRLGNGQPVSPSAHTALRCINFAERASGTSPGFVRSGYLQGYTEVLEHLDIKMRILPCSEEEQGGWENLFSPSYTFSEQGCVLINLRSAPMMAWLDEREVPFVVQSNRTYDTSAYPEHHSVCINKVRGGFDSTRHLLELGHRRIGFVGEISNGLRMHDVYEGFLAASAVEGVSTRPEDMLDLSTNEREMALSPVRRLLERTTRPSALVAQNDAMALAVLDACRQLGIRVPAELSVVGFDDLPEAAQSDPPLTTVSNPRVLLGRAAVEMLIEAGEGKFDKPQSRVLEGCLVVRGSTAGPNSA